MDLIPRTAAAVASGALLVALLAGCTGSPADGMAPAPAGGTAVSPVGGANAAQVGGAPAPADGTAAVPPGATSTAPTEEVTVAPVVALVGGPQPALDAAAAAVAERGGRVLAADGTGTDVDAERVITAAADAEPDVVVVVGSWGLDALDRVSSQRLGQRFLVLGAQLPEPTSNVTAVVWAGADARWSSDAADPELLVARVAEALGAGWSSAVGAPGGKDGATRDQAEVVVLD